MMQDLMKSIMDEMMSREKSTHNKEKSSFLILSLSPYIGIGSLSISNKHSVVFKFSHDYQIYTCPNFSLTSSPHPLNPILSLNQSSSPQMRRDKALVHFLLLWLLLAAFRHNSITIPKVQATESVDFKLRPAKSGSRPTTGYISTTGVEGKKIHKRPSGPNPVGNRRPPSRT